MNSLLHRAGHKGERSTGRKSHEKLTSRDNPSQATNLIAWTFPPSTTCSMSGGESSFLSVRLFVLSPHSCRWETQDAFIITFVDRWLCYGEVPLHLDEAQTGRGGGEAGRNVLQVVSQGVSISFPPRSAPISRFPSLAFGVAHSPITASSMALKLTEAHQPTPSVPPLPAPRFPCSTSRL
ncbi:hypothetical protein E2C01_091414 [Portunus trituberculatus]|uniref:Uncharacterized protein n=1 Tax=Portunus trituberculatus TaxID=210409 RepID=A0A5B7JJ01_PORTR|nr:hypothetical protein [Portunus trituberculatus]